jgi:hypothetical protein
MQILVLILVVLKIVAPICCPEGQGNKYHEKKITRNAE